MDDVHLKSSSDGSEEHMIKERTALGRDCGEVQMMGGIRGRYFSKAQTVCRRTERVDELGRQSVDGGGYAPRPGQASKGNLDQGESVRREGSPCGGLGPQRSGQGVMYGAFLISLWFRLDDNILVPKKRENPGRLLGFEMSGSDCGFLAWRGQSRARYRYALEGVVPIASCQLRAGRAKTSRAPVEPIRRRLSGRPREGTGLQTSCD
jgi:hypothetical protein